MRDGTSLLGKLVPLIIELMMDSADTVWGEACYPVVEGNPAFVAGRLLGQTTRYSPSITPCASNA